MLCRFLLSLLLLLCFAYNTISQNVFTDSTTHKQYNNIIDSILVKKLDTIAIYKARLAEAYYHLGNYNKALTYYKDLYTKDSNDISFIKKYTNINESLSRVKSNIILYKRLVQIDSLNKINYYQKLAPLLENQSLLKDALDAYSINFYVNNKDWDAALHACDLALKMELHNKADSIINIALMHNPDICAIKYKKGGIAYLLGNYDTSIRYIQQAFSCGDTAITYFKTIGLSYQYIDEYDSALYYLSKYVSVTGGDEKCFSSISSIYTEKNNLDSAAAYMSKACKVGISPNYLQNSKSLAYMYEQGSKYDEALNMYYMIYFSSKDAEAMYGIAHIEDKEKHYENALLWYRRYLDSGDINLKNISLNRKIAIEKILHDKKSTVWK